MAKTNTKALSCTIDLDNFNILAELRWAKRVETMSEMVNLAIADYVTKHAPEAVAANGDAANGDAAAVKAEEAKPEAVKKA